MSIGLVRRRVSSTTSISDDSTVSTVSSNTRSRSTSRSRSRTPTIREDIVKWQNDLLKSQQKTQGRAQAQKTTSTSQIDDEAFCLRRDNRRLRCALSECHAILNMYRSQENNATLCRSCKDRSINCCLNPCGHLVLCTRCAGSVTRCPICERPCQMIRIAVA